MKFYTCGPGPKPPSLFEHADTLFLLVCVTYKPLVSNFDHTGIRKPYWYPTWRNLWITCFCIYRYSLLRLQSLSLTALPAVESLHSVPSGHLMVATSCIPFWASSMHHHCLFSLGLFPLQGFIDRSPFAHLWSIVAISSKWASCKLLYKLYWSKESLCVLLVCWDRLIVCFSSDHPEICIHVLLP